MLGALVADRTVVWRSESLLLSLDHLRAYPEGFEFRIGARSRSSLHPGTPARVLRHDGGFTGPQVHVVEHLLRVGLEFSDGTRLTNLSPVVGAGLDEPPPTPLLVRRGGGGIGGRWDEHLWVWGLPPDGPLTVVLESPAHDVPATAVVLDGGAVRAAAQQAEVLWDLEVASYAAVGLPPPVTVYAPEPRTGAPGPTDPERARAEVVHAFAAMHEVVDGALANVEWGDALVPAQREVDQRFGVAHTAARTVERVVFASPTEAVVWFSVWLGSHPVLTGNRGTAVLHDGRWRVSRETFCGLLARVGIRCPAVRRLGGSP